jgi:hypothetical protein
MQSVLPAYALRPAIERPSAEQHRAVERTYQR